MCTELRALVNMAVSMLLPATHFGIHYCYQGPRASGMMVCTPTFHVLDKMAKVAAASEKNSSLAVLALGYSKNVNFRF